MNQSDWPPVVCLSQTGDGAIPDEQVTDLLDKADEQRYRLSHALLTEELALFKESMSLHFLALSFAADNASEWNEQHRASVALMARVFNLLRAEAKLVLYGYWGETPPLRRTVHECVSRVLLFHWYPEEAVKFLKNRYTSQTIVNRKIAKRLTGDDAEIYGKLRRLYNFESKRVHPHSEYLELGTYGTKEDIGSRAMIGGVGDAEHTLTTFTAVLQLCLLAIKTLGVIGLHEATDDWVDRYANLEYRILRLVEEHTSQFGSDSNLAPEA